jgi:hypothetical protein
LGQQATLLQGFQRVPSPPEDARLTLTTDSKASRRLLLRQLKLQRNGIKAMVQLTPQEKANKALAYRLLQGKNVLIRDMGDMMTLSPAGQPNNSPHNLQLYLQPDQVESEVNQVIDFVR